MKVTYSGVNEANGTLADEDARVVHRSDHGCEDGCSSRRASASGELTSKGDDSREPEEATSQVAIFLYMPCGTVHIPVRRNIGVAAAGLVEYIRAIRLRDVVVQELVDGALLVARLREDPGETTARVEIARCALAISDLHDGHSALRAGDRQSCQHPGRETGGG